MAKKPDRNYVLRTYLRVQKSVDRDVHSLLLRASADIDAQLKKILGANIGDRIRREQLLLVKKVIEEELAKLLRRVGYTIAAAKHEAAAAAITSATAYDAVLMQTAHIPNDLIEFYRASAAATARRGVDAALERLFGSSYIPLSDQVYKTHQWASGIVDRYVDSSLARGLSAREMAKGVRDMIRPDVRGGVSYASMRLARTEINNAFHATNAAKAAETPWVEGVRWALSGRHPTPDDCNAYAEEALNAPLPPGVWPKDMVPMKPHPQCFPEGTLVVAEDVSAVTKRWHDQGLVEVSVGEDSVLMSGTYNHPALTRRGWVALSKLQEGDYVALYRADIHSGRKIGPIESAKDPHNKKIVSRIEDVATAINVSSGMSTSTMPSSAEYFHGDGATHGEVDIVWAAGSLEDYFRQWSGYGAFKIGSPNPPRLSGLRGLDLVRHRLGLSAHGVVRSLSHLESSFWAQSLDTFGSTSGANTLSLQHRSNLRTSEADDSADLIHRLSGDIQFSRVNRVSFRPRWSGHVYNLQARSGWYTANNIIVHNCLCTTVNELPSVDSFTDAMLAGEYDEYLDKVMARSGYSADFIRRSRFG